MHQARRELFRWLVAVLVTLRRDWNHKVVNKLKCPCCLAHRVLNVHSVEQPGAIDKLLYACKLFVFDIETSFSWRKKFSGSEQSLLPVQATHVSQGR